MRFSTAISALLSINTVFAALPSDWATRSIYFLMTDRFARTDGVTSACSNLSNYCGGTWAGITAKLSYIQGLGYDAIWITPIIENTSGGYHGYWAQNIYNINTNHGTANDLKALISAAHAKGMYVMLDLVVNHMGQGDITTFTPFNSAQYYHDYCLITDYTNQSSVELCRFTAALPDVKTDDASVRLIYQNWIRDLLSAYSFDGLRLDTAKHVEKTFYPPFLAAAGNMYAVGEVYNGDPVYDSGYETSSTVSVIPGVLNYPMYFAITAAYANKGPLTALVSEHDQVSSDFAHPELLGTFLDNHDNPRFLNVNSDWTLLLNALAYTILSRGVPILYYGTEQGYNGGNDPANRVDLWSSGYGTTGILYSWISKVMAVKKAAGGLGANDHVHLYSSSNAYAFSRLGGKVVVLTTNGGSGTSGSFCFNTNVASGTVFTSALTGTKYTAGTSGNICITVSNGQPEILTNGLTTTTTITSATTLATSTGTTTSANTCAIVTATVYV